MSDKLTNWLLSKDVSLEEKVRAIVDLHDGNFPDAELEGIINVITERQGYHASPAACKIMFKTPLRHIMQLYWPQAGDANKGHKHTVPHDSLLTRGSVRFEREGHPPEVLRAPSVVHIPAGVQHHFIALEDNTVTYCVFEGIPEGEEVDQEFDLTSHKGTVPQL